MKFMEDSPETLDAAIESISRNKAVEAEASRVLTSATMQTIQDLRSLADSTPLREEFVDELESRLHKEAVESVRRTPPSQRLGLQWWRRSWWWTVLPGRARLMRVRLLITAVVVLLLSVGAIVFWIMEPHPVSAAVILARANQAASDPGTFGLKSYTGVISGESRSNITAPKAESSQHVWWLAPKHRRIETHVVVSAFPAASQPTAQKQQTNDEILVTDGINAWGFDPTMKHVVVMDPAFFGTGGPASGVTDLQGLLSIANQDATATLLGTDQVAGRPAYVLALTPKPGTGQAAIAAHWKSWVDQEAYLPLRMEGRDDQGNILVTWAFSTLQLNPTLDESLFTFTPPAGAEIVWQRPPTQAELVQEWQQLAQRVPFELLIPGNVPATLTPGMPSYDAQKGQSIEQIYRSKMDPRAMVLIEGVTTTVAQARPPELVKVGSMTGRYYGSSGINLIVLEVNGTQISIQGNELSKEELFQVAASLQPVLSGATPFATQPPLAPGPVRTEQVPVPTP